MENLAETIELLITEHGAETFSDAVKAHKVKADGDPPKCPKGYILVGNTCVLDI